MKLYKGFLTLIIVKEKSVQVFFLTEKSCFYYIPHNVKYHIIYQWSPPQKSLKRLSSTFSIKLEELKALLLMSSLSVDFFVVKLFKVKCHVSD